MDVLKIDRVVRFASMAHKGQVRRTDGSPYITHPFTCALYVMDALNNDKEVEQQTKEDILVAALLHDVWEDTDYDLEVIEKRFGANVAKLVRGASEEDQSIDWNIRKKHTIEFLKTAPLDLRYVICADKMHNVVSMLNDFKQYGNDIWTNFKKGKQPQIWYYSSIAVSLAENLDSVPEFFHTYRKLVKQLAGI